MNKFVIVMFVDIVTRSSERCCISTWVYPEDVHWTESWPRQDHLLAFHLCYRSVVC